MGLSSIYVKSNLTGFFFFLSKGFKIIFFLVIDPETCTNQTTANLMYLNSSKILGLMPDCKLTCSKIVSEVATCSKTIGNRTVLNVTYFLFRFEAIFVNSEFTGKMSKFSHCGANYVHTNY